MNGRAFPILNHDTYLVIAITEAGVIPATLVYLAGFYKNTEVATRLAWFWGIQVSNFNHFMISILK